MNAEIFAAVDMLEKEKGVPRDYMLEKIRLALLAALKRDNAGAQDNLLVEIDEDKKEIRACKLMLVVEEVEQAATQMTVDEARRYVSSAGVGDMVRVEIGTNSMGRIATQSAKQMIIQAVRESERGTIFNEMASKEHEILVGKVTRIDTRTGAIYAEVGSKNDQIIEVQLPLPEQVRSESYKPGDRIRLYLIEVRKGQRGVHMVTSRTHPGLVKRLFELEVPEIHDGVVEIMGISREPGSRTKIAVQSNEPDVDPVGACVGPKGSRVNEIVEELFGEKIDIIKYSDDPSKFVSSALAPAEILGVYIAPDSKSCRVVVADDQLSLAIGREGQNARLAAKLTGYKIDIKPLSQAGKSGE